MTTQEETRLLIQRSAIKSALIGATNPEAIADLKRRLADTERKLGKEV